jgi:hypothetical protein
VDSLASFLQRRINATVFIAGVIVGVWFVGLHNFFPWNMDWLLQGGDSSAYQVSFEFFRQAPLFQWPMTATPTYIEGANTVLVSANGVFGIPAKIIGLMFQGQFQFYGVWIAVTFGLQALLSFRLLGLFINHQVVQLLATSMFLLAPTFIYRIGTMSHFELGSHWMILLALYLYFNNQRFIFNWSLLLLISILINVYISAMATLIFFGSLATEYFLRDKQMNLRKVVTFIGVPLLWLGVGFTFMGYFNYGGSAGGTGFFRLNVLAYFNPGFSETSSYSQMFDAIAPQNMRQLFIEEQEMFQYLGIGGIVLLCGVVWFAVTEDFSGRLRRHAFLALGLAGMLTLAFSYRIGFAGKEFVYWWPEGLKDARQIFRAATRFGWPLYYMLMLAGVVATYRKLPRKWAPFAIAAICVFNLIDVFPAVRDGSFAAAKHSDAENSSSFDAWEEILSEKSHLKIYPNFDFQVDSTSIDTAKFESDWLMLVRLALENDLSTNFGYVGRPIQDFVAAEDASIKENLSIGNIDKESVYIIGNKETWKKFVEVAGADAKAEEIDGFYVITSS